MDTNHSMSFGVSLFQFPTVASIYETSLYNDNFAKKIYNFRK